MEENLNSPSGVMGLTSMEFIRWELQLAFKDTIIQIYSTNYCIALRCVSPHLLNDRVWLSSEVASSAHVLFAEKSESAWVD